MPIVEAATAPNHRNISPVPSIQTTNVPIAPER
jgi:hypothetical protein